MRKPLSLGIEKTLPPFAKRGVHVNLYSVIEVGGYTGYMRLHEMM